MLVFAKFRLFIISMQTFSHNKMKEKLKENKKIQDKQAFIIGIAKNKIMKYINQKGKIKTISIFQEKENEEKVVDIDSRN